VIAGVAAGLVWIVTQWVENWDSIKATFREIGADLKAQMDSIWQGIQSVFSAIREGFSDFVSSADGWGADLIRGLVGGILGKIAMVRDAVSTVAGTISAWLHFSVPDVGPLTEYEQWMPDFIGGLVRGIERTRPMLQQAVGALATDLMLTPEPGNVAAMTSGGGGEDGILSIVGILSQYLPYLPQLAKLQVVTDTGTLVGELVPGMDRALGERSVRERRL
jgi:phage-related protein